MQDSITEVVVGLQMNNHKNVLKLLGCCLETPAPTLVFKFAENGCLSDHIYEKEEELSWKSRLRIAIEVADAISYLHTGTSRPIIHRNIKPSNIFLDKHFGAKLTEFGYSVSIPPGETYVETLALGTLGYLDPVYLETSKCTVKSDVFSFALVLFEILDHSDDDDDDYTYGAAGIWRYFTVQILKEGNDYEQKMACAELARRCMARNPEERPTMVEVAYELRRIQKGITKLFPTPLTFDY
ncbi:wall-associated receptor kinase-like 8 [Telopea speciosissima]|uniref:wall-associated receptor kinase-like 8 n=1 Tax=Telopea speciosissima TaxID=54955 RepID=UPI001CC7A879|nr:wall-associated receptor kinase-like 8 [Telopea speciosissima]